jgi:hypothetical protein
MQVTLSPTRRCLGWAVMMGGILIGQCIPFAAWYFLGVVWIFTALVPMFLVMGLSARLSDHIWKPYRDAQKSRAGRGSTQHGIDSRGQNGK